MNPLILPWSLMCVGALLLFVIFLREVLVVMRTPVHHPERAFIIFNCCVLLVFFVFSLYGVNYFFKRDQEFSYQFPRYPTARYAPERELLQKGSDWIYVTADTPEQVIAYYRNVASENGYTTTGEDFATSTHLMLMRGARTLFLTAQKEQHSTVLYFSEHGEVRTYQRTQL